MLGNADQFHMGIAHLLYIVGQTYRCLTVVIEAVRVLFGPGMLHPGADMYLVDGHGVGDFVEFFSLFEPLGVMPFVVCNVGNAGSSSRPELGLICKGISLVKLFIMHSDNEKLIKLPDGRARNKYFKHTDGTGLCHYVGFGIPPIEFADHGNAFCIRCPDREIGSLYAVLFCGVRAKLFVKVIVDALTKQILVKLCKLHFISHNPPSSKRLILLFTSISTKRKTVNANSTRVRRGFLH